MTIILCIALLASLLAGCTQQSGQTEPSAKPDTVLTPQDEIVSYTVGEIQEFGRNDASVWELLQDLLPNLIVYRGAGGVFQYASIDRSLPQSDYDWSNLVEVSETPREVEYAVDGETVSIKGIDVSTYQGDIDWEKVAASGVKFVFIRLGYRGYESGLLVKDDRFEDNIRGALQNGIAVGVYFVTQAISVEEAVEEAQFVMENIRPYNVTWPIVLDIEDAASATARTAELSQQARTDHAIAFCETVKESGYTPMLYCNIRWFIEKLDITRITDYDKWFAQYFRKPFFPYAFQVWQYSSTGRIDGIEGNVDYNISFVDYGNLPAETGD
ncbi:MAG: glycoside hydrolase family 25 protein [Firmicutes bacterium]|nr:glycoside hydrolase family 25 protein [Bacillota bacterium]MBQ2147103.1 glycoside hydrolase family 25 protein [Bacillota bacterium]